MELLEELSEIFANIPFKEDIRLNLNQYLNGGSTTDIQKIEQANIWLAWAKQKRELKIVRANVPVGILPMGISGTLLDVKVFTRGPDDIIFDKNKDIRDKVARGNCFLEVSGGSCPGLRCVVYALKKFTGGLGDDDDRESGDNFTWKRYFLKPLDEAKEVVCTRKANGEAAHLSAVKIEGVVYICAGSKNVHMIFRNRDDIEKYTEDRYRIASEICLTMLDVLETIGEEKQRRLLEFLCQTELTGIFEILHPGHQHVENFSHMTNPELHFITWTSRDLSPSPGPELCSMSPHVAIEIARAFGLTTVDYDTIPVNSVDDRMKQIRQGYGFEGEVLYFLDDTNTVIGLLKKKTIWYILCRAIREKLRGAVTLNKKNSSTFSLRTSLSKLTTRVDQIRTWLGLDEASTQAWKTLGCQCMEWTIDNMDKGQLDVTDISDKFPVTWQKYLEATQQTDKLTVKWNEPEGSDD